MWGIQTLVHVRRGSRSGCVPGLNKHTTRSAAHDGTVVALIARSACHDSCAVQEREDRELERPMPPEAENTQWDPISDMVEVLNAACHCKPATATQHSRIAQVKRKFFNKQLLEQFDFFGDLDAQQEAVLAHCSSHGASLFSVMFCWHYACCDLALGLAGAHETRLTIGWLHWSATA